MSIIAKDTASRPHIFIPCPSGVLSAVVVDVVDLGEVEKRFQSQPAKLVHEVKLVWEVAEMMDDERPFIVSRRFTLSLNRKANLRAFLESWRTRPFTDQELAGFDMESLVGVPALISVMHELGTALDGTPATYARVVSASRLPHGIEPLIRSGKYVRVRERERVTGAVQLVA